MRDAAAERRLIALLDRAFRKLAGEAGTCERADLARALELRSDFLVERMFHVLDTDGNGSVSFDEFSRAAHCLLYGTQQEKIRLAFRIHDLNGDGRIDAQEFLRMVSMSLLEERERTHAPLAPESVSAALTERLFRTLDENGDNSVSYEEFEQLALAEHSLLELASRSEARWLVGDAEIFRAPGAELGLGQRMLRALQNRRAWTAYIALWMLANALIVAYAAHRFRECGVDMVLARAAGASVKLNSAFILLSVMRGFLTKVRGLGVARLLPLDDSLLIHKKLGCAIGVGALVHVVAHVHRLYFALPEPCAVLPQPSTTLTLLTGYTLLVFTALMLVFALPQIRRTRYFHWFATAHLLYVPWFGLAFCHGPNWRNWLLLPVLVFSAELAIRLRRRSRASYPAELTGLSSRVSRLRLERPQGFDFKAGDYALVKIPCLAPHEWHPFTISSAPESAELTFHIRDLGTWTRRLYELSESRHVSGRNEPIAVYLDGPYGSPSAHVLSRKHAVMIGAGIGVTPFASVLDSIVTRANAGKLELERLYFYWVSKDPSSFAWFKDLLLELEQKDRRALVDVRIYLSRARANIAALALNLARNLAHDSGRPDLFTGLRAQTRLGEPDFERELDEIAQRHAPDKVEVFYCGGPELGAKLKRTCSRLGLSFRPEPF